MKKVAEPDLLGGRGTPSQLCSPQHERSSEPLSIAALGSQDLSFDLCCLSQFERAVQDRKVDVPAKVRGLLSIRCRVRHRTAP
jgi:hypothetical protein